jgi:hypothetical protein
MEKNTIPKLKPDRFLYFTHESSAHGTFESNAGRGRASIR